MKKEKDSQTQHSIEELTTSLIASNNIIETLSKKIPIANTDNESKEIQSKINITSSIRDRLQNKLFEKLVELYG